MPEGGIVNIETGNRTLHGGEHTGDFVLLTVSDTGVGMDEATKARVFGAILHHQGPGKGTGMGLSTVQAAMQNAQGWIEVESAVGQGSRFRAYFPRAHSANEGTQT